MPVQAATTRRIAATRLLSISGGERWGRAVLPGPPQQIWHGIAIEVEETNREAVLKGIQRLGVHGNPTFSRKTDFQYQPCSFRRLLRRIDKAATEVEILDQHAAFKETVKRTGHPIVASSRAHTIEFVCHTSKGYLTTEFMPYRVPDGIRTRAHFADS